MRLFGPVDRMYLSMSSHLHTPLTLSHPSHSLIPHTCMSSHSLTPHTCTPLSLSHTSHLHVLTPAPLSRAVPLLLHHPPLLTITSLPFCLPCAQRHSTERSGWKEGPMAALQRKAPEHAAAGHAAPRCIWPHQIADRQSMPQQSAGCSAKAERKGGADRWSARGERTGGQRGRADRPCLQRKGVITTRHCTRHERLLNTDAWSAPAGSGVAGVEHLDDDISQGDHLLQLPEKVLSPCMPCSLRFTTTASTCVCVHRYGVCKSLRL